ncbi:MAG TPA: hypothetical protein VGL86_32990 [Polyangia bacterium]|jgi:hypothetical protein
MRRVAVLVLGGFASAIVGGVAAADPPPPAETMPYKVFWSFPNDDETAIDVDEPDLTNSDWDSQLWKFAVAMLKCDVKRSKILAQHRDETPVREIRVQSIEAGGKVRSTSRCVMTLKDWRKRIGKDLVYRLDDELDAHASFLMPRRGPGMPAKTTLSPEDSAVDTKAK